MDAETETLIPTNGGHFSYALAGNTIGRKPENGGNGLGFDTETMYTLTKTDLHGVVKPQIIHGTQDPCVSDIAFAQGRNNGGENVVIKPRAYSQKTIEQDVTLQIPMQVRRLTPVECERLQGFPDNYTNIKPNGKPTPDGPRYKALGNSMAVPVMSWIGKRIAEVEQIKTNKEAA